MKGVEIRNMSSCDWNEVRRIYQEGMDTRNATFQMEAPSWEEWDAGHRKDCRLVATAEHKILGWAALSPVSGRCVYGGVAEISVYIDTTAQGKGIGSLLLSKLIMDSEQHGIWTLQAGIFPENKASIKLHLNCGFREVGVREKLGKMEDTWRDVVLLERRSKKIK